MTDENSDRWVTLMLTPSTATSITFSASPRGRTRQSTATGGASGRMIWELTMLSVSPSGRWPVIFKVSFTSRFLPEYWAKRSA